MLSDGWSLHLNPVAVADLADDREAWELCQDVGDGVAELAAEYAPKESGAGAASIHAEVGRDDDGVYADVSYDDEHYYMGFHETGTVNLPARPFLRPALDATEV